MTKDRPDPLAQPPGRREWVLDRPTPERGAARRYFCGACGVQLEARRVLSAGAAIACPACGALNDHPQRRTD